MPLSDLEATNVLNIVHANKLGNNYTFTSINDLFTSWIFFLFGENATTARLASALFGSLLVFFPIILEDYVGRKTSLIYALFLAFDPILINVSRLADSRMITLVSLSFGVGFINVRHSILAGICFVILLMCGLPAWNGLSILIIVLFVFLALNIYTKKKVINNSINNIIRLFRNNRFWLSVLCVLGLAFLIKASTISFISAGLIRFLQQSLIPIPIYGSTSRILLIFLSSYPLFILLLCFGLFFSYKNKEIAFPSFVIFTFSILIYVMILPSVNLLDMAWLVIPLYYFSAKGLIFLIEYFCVFNKTTLLISIPVISSFIFIYLLVLRIIIYQPYNFEIGRTLISIIGIIFFLTVILIILAWGWSIRLGMNGFLAGLVLLLLLHQLSITTHALGIASRPEQEVWRSSVYFQDAQLLKKIIMEVNRWNSGTSRKTDVVLVNLMDNNILWELKDCDIRMTDALLPNDKPSILITRIDQTINYKEDYYRQVFIRSSYPQWLQDPLHAIFSSDFYKWLFLRMSTLEQERMILWLRTDLFPGNSIFYEVD